MPVKTSQWTKFIALIDENFQNNYYLGIKHCKVITIIILLCKIFNLNNRCLMSAFSTQNSFLVFQRSLDYDVFSINQFDVIVIGDCDLNTVNWQTIVLMLTVYSSDHCYYKT